jgi:hypothetical protein
VPGVLLIAGGLTFVPTYDKIDQVSSESRVPYVLACQNGFFRESALDALLKGIRKETRSAHKEGDPVSAWWI